MDERSPTVTRPIRRIFEGECESVEDTLVVEDPLEIRVRGQGIAVTMRTPGHDCELAAGFLVTEGVIRNFSDVLAINHCTQGDAAETGNVVNVFLSPKVEVDMEKLTRHVFASSSCGLCGKASIDAVQQQFAPIEKSSLLALKPCEPFRQNWSRRRTCLPALVHCMRRLSLTRTGNCSCCVKTWGDTTRSTR